MPPALPSIYAYTDFRAYLGDSYQARKASERKYSHRFIADKVKASSSGWFSDIVEDRLNLAGAQLLPLAGLLRLNIQFFPLSQ